MAPPSRSRTTRPMAAARCCCCRTRARSSSRTASASSRRSPTSSANPKKLKIIEIEAAQTPRSLADVAAAAINTNYAVDAKIEPTSAILREDPKGPYVNLIAVREADKDKPWVKALVEAYHSPRDQGLRRRALQGLGPRRLVSSSLPAGRSWSGTCPGSESFRGSSFQPCSCHPGQAAKRRRSKIHSRTSIAKVPEWIPGLPPVARDDLG
jgi:hypothetical protein